MAIQQVAGDNTGAAAEGGNGNPSGTAPGYVGKQGQSAGKIDHLPEIIGLDHARLGQGSFHYGAIAGHAGCMAHGGPGTLLTFSALKDHHRFCGILADLKKPPALLDRFQVQADDGCIRILQKIFQNVAFIDIHLVSDGAGLAHPQFVAGHHVDEKSRGEHSALHDKGNVSGQQPLVPDAGCNKRKNIFVDHVHQSHAVGPPDADAGAAGYFGQLILQFLPFFPGFGKARALDDNTRYPPVRTCLNHLRHYRGRHKNDGHVHGVRHLVDVGIAGKAVDFGISGIHGIYVTGKTGH